MTPTEIIFTSLLIAVLLAVAGFFGWRQVQALRGGAGFGADDRRYAIRQAWRRLFCCGLMVAIAGLLVGGFVLDAQFREFHHQAKTPPEDRDKEFTDEYKGFARFMGVYWSGVFVLTFALLGLAAVDAWAIARFGIRKHRQLQADHRADLEEQIAQLRRQRNGHG